MCVTFLPDQSERPGLSTNEIEAVSRRLSKAEFQLVRAQSTWQDLAQLTDQARTNLAFQIWIESENSWTLCLAFMQSVISFHSSAQYMLLSDELFFLSKISKFCWSHCKVLFSFFLSLFVLSVPHFWSVSKQIEGVDMSRDQLLRRSYPKKYWDARDTHSFDIHYRRKFGVICILTQLIS